MAAASFCASVVDGDAPAYLAAAGSRAVLSRTAGSAAAGLDGLDDDGGRDGAEQGVWLESATPLPAEMLHAAGFGQGGALDGLAPGRELALLLPGAGGFSGLGDAELTGVLRGWRRVSSWAAAMEHAAVAELSGRRIEEARSAGACVSEAERFAAAEVAAALTLTRCAAEGLVGRALMLGDLPATAGALGAGVIDAPKALVIVNGVAGLGDGLARRVEAKVLAGAAAQTTGQLRQAVARAAAAADPAGAQQRHDEAARSARVERWTEDAGTGALAGRDLPAADVLAADHRVNALAAALRADGAAGGMDLLRARVFIGLLLGRPVAAPASGGPAPDSPAPDSPAPAAPAPDCAAPDRATSGGLASGGLVPAGLRRVPAGQVAAPTQGPSSSGWGRLSGSVNLTVPLATLAGLARQPGEVAGFGPVPAAVAAQIAAAGWAGPGMRWCVTVTGAGGRAAGHGCAVRRPAGTTHTAGTAKTGGATGPAKGGGDSAGPGGEGAADNAEGSGDGGGWEFTVTVSALATGQCDHRRESAGYVPPASLRHLIEVRDLTCSFPGCRRPARQCDLDHTLAYGHGGRSCECNLAPLCRFHHKLKQTRGWTLTQPAPGILQWTAPSGWKYTVTPRGHP
ncbi:MAG: HNH endonuclease signature motif containing protein, partial [Micromonosporaceae bacterium]